MSTSKNIGLLGENAGLFRECRALLRECRALLRDLNLCDSSFRVIDVMPIVIID